MTEPRHELAPRPAPCSQPSFLPAVPDGKPVAAAFVATVPAVRPAYGKHSLT